MLITTMNLISATIWNSDKISARNKMFKVMQLVVSLKK